MQDSGIQTNYLQQVEQTITSSTSLLDQLDAKVPGIVDSGLVSSWLSYRAEPKDFWPVLGKTPVEGYMLSTGFGGNGVIEVPAATRDLAKLIMRDESTPLLENWAFERLLED